MISWDGVLIIMFAALVSTSPRRTAIAGMLAVSMNPLGMLVARAEGIWQFASVFAVFDMHFPDYLLVGVAAIISHVVTKLGRQVGKARELGSYHHLTKRWAKGEWRGVARASSHAGAGCRDRAHSAGAAGGRIGS
jgi:hypothetical protein